MKILNIAKYDLIKLTREKSVLVIMLLVPVIFILVMNFVYGSFDSPGGEPKIPVGISNRDTGSISTELLKELRNDKTIYINEVSEDKLNELVRNSGVEIGFIIPENFSSEIERGNSPEIEALKLPSAVDFMAIEGIVNGALAKLRVKEGVRSYFKEKLGGLDSNKSSIILSDISGRLDENLRKPLLVQVKSTIFDAGNGVLKAGTKTQVALGVMAMFVMLTVIMSAGEILEEKKNNTWGRLNITPTGKYTLITGKILGTFLRGWVQVVVLMFFGSLVMGINPGNSIGASTVLVSVYLLCVTSLAMFMSSLVKTNAQLGALSAVIVTCTSMLSGCYWPVELETPIMQKIAAFLPQYWAMKGLRNTIEANMGFESILTPLIVLMAMGIVFFILSAFIGRFKVGLRKNHTVVSDLEVKA